MKYSFLYTENNKTLHEFGEFSNDKTAITYGKKQLNQSGKTLLHIINMSLEEQIYIDNIECKKYLDPITLNK